MYDIIKAAHIACALVSIAWFAWRGARRLQNPQYQESRFTKITPHVIDSALLATAIVLVVLSGQYPGQSTWVTAKVVGLFIYIGFGLAAKRSKASQSKQLVYYILALATAGYIVAVAISKSTTPLLHCVAGC